MFDGIRAATVGDRDVVVATVVAAFERDPALRYFFPDDDRYVEQATVLFGALFDRRVGYGSIWMHSDGRAVALWAPPHPAHEGAGLPEAIDADAVARIMTYAAAMAVLLPDVADHWYLGVLATHPEHVGRGLGRALLRHGVEQAAGQAAHLETTNPANVAFYESAGWRVVATNDGGQPLRIWVMRHDGRP